MTGFSFPVIGGSDVGLKVRDIEDCRSILESVGFTVLQGPVVAAEVFDNFCSENGLNEDATNDGLTLELGMSSGAYEANKQLLRILEVDKAYAIRSSARSDRGGNGIFETTFFVPSGDKGEDMKMLWFCEREVYASEFSDKAKAWRRKHAGKIGMALWITPVVGTEVNDDADGKMFYPSLNGEAYTNFHEKPLARVVAGLAYRDAGNELADFTTCPDGSEFRRIIGYQRILSLVHMTGRTCVPYPLKHSKTMALANMPNEFPIGLFKMLNDLREHGDFYIEWATASPDSDEIVVTQCAPWKDKPMDSVAPNTEGLKLLVGGSDIVNHGKVMARYLVYVSHQYWFKHGVVEVKMINEGLKDFILVVPEPAFSSQADTSYVIGGMIGLVDMGNNLKRGIGYEHFSNACGLIELQDKPVDLLDNDPLAEYERMNRTLAGIPITDHANHNRGGKHFKQLCDQENILFLGADFDPRVLERKADPYISGEGIQIWQGEFILANDIHGNNGSLYFREGSIQPIKCKYSPNWLDNISMKLRRLANDEPDEERQGMLYCVHYLIPCDSTTVIPDPFYIDPICFSQDDGKGKTVEYLRRFIEEGTTILPGSWSPKLEGYFQKLLASLEK